MSERYKFHPSGIGVIRLSDMTVIMPGETAAWREYMRRVREEGYEAEPADPIVQPTQSRRLPKTVIVERLTDEELERFRQIRTALPARLVFMWEEAHNNEVNPDDERLRKVFSDVLGPERTVEVLR